MPDRVKEKLVEMIVDAMPSCYSDVFATQIANHLIANGVTVQEDCKACAEATQNCIVKLQEQIAELRSMQEWISVKDRLPEEPLQTVLVTNGKETCVAVYSVVYDEFGVMCGKGKTFGVTHWMPLPQPPKGE